MSQRIKVEFSGAKGDTLAGLMETPDGPVRGYVLFAHCFTCGKDIAAASRIARQLVRRNFSVLRFDFTGLGSSDGDFANTNFSSNVQDLVAAADFMRQQYQAPGLLIGHSLGGTAVLRAATHIPESVGVVTIGSPADAQHVAHQFSTAVDTIQSKGEATVNLAGREFSIQKQFLDDIAQTSVRDIGKMRDALLVMHAPADTIVSIHEAERIYQAARHPKSFVSLGNADHLLSNRADAAYAADVIASWAQRLLPEASPTAAAPVEVKAGEVAVHESDRRFRLDVHSDDHHWIADEPTRAGGGNAGPDPYEQLLASVGTCTAMTLRMYAGRKKWPLDDVAVVLRHRREHDRDCAECDEKPQQLDILERDITLTGDLTHDQRDRLLQIADKCPVHRTLTGQLSITTREVSV